MDTDPVIGDKLPIGEFTAVSIVSVPGRPRCAILLAAGFLAGAAQPPRDPPARSPTATAAGPQPSATASPRARFRPYPGYSPDRCYHAEDHDAADLCAQWRAAIAAESAASQSRRANAIAMAAALLSAATLIGLIITIWQTNGALAEARRGNRLNLLFERRSRRESRRAALDQAEALAIARSTAAAQAQVAIASDTAKKRLRAYVDFDGIDHLVDPVNDVCHGISICVRNFGLTPAVDVRMTRRIATLDHDVISWRGEEDVVPVGDLAPGDLTKSNMRFTIPPDAWSRIKAGMTATQIEVTLTYRDAFDDTHDMHRIVESTRNEPFSINLDRSTDDRDTWGR